MTTRSVLIWKWDSAAKNRRFTVAHEARSARPASGGLVVRMTICAAQTKTPAKAGVSRWVQAPTWLLLAEVVVTGFAGAADYAELLFKAVSIARCGNGSEFVGFYA